MIEDLQRVADVLAKRLDRAVAIDDLNFRLIVYTSHVGVVDPVRTTVVLTRQAPADAVTYVRSFPIRDATGPVRIPGNDDLELLPRVCIPIRCKGFHFGWLWLIDPNESVTDEELERATAAADEAGLFFYWDRISKEYLDSRERELLRDLLAEASDVRELAAQELIDGNHFTSNSGVVVLVLRLVDPSHRTQSEDTRMALSGALDSVVGLLPPKESLRLVRPDHGLLLTRQAQLDRNRTLPTELHRLGAKSLGRADLDLIVGVGTNARRLADTRDSYRDALLATRVAEVVPMYRPIARFADLGVYAMLAALPLADLNANLIHPGIAKLAEIDPDLPATLELFLDRAGDTRAVADLLHLHRSTIYYRLKRIEEVAGVNLENGEDRLALHLSLKIAKLADASPERPVSPMGRSESVSDC
jgi:hypothetical protein